MGVFGDRFVGDFYGHKIEVDGAVGLLSAEFVLSIDNKKVDRLSILLGQASLRGEVIHSDTAHAVVVRIDQGITGTNATLEIAGKAHPFQRLR